MKGSHRLRKGRSSIQHQAYFVTTAVKGRMPVFSDPELAAVVLDALKWLDQTASMVLEAAVVMPDHLHFVAVLNNENLHQVLHSLKSYTAKRLNSKLGRQGEFWQPQYYDHAIRKDETLNEVVLYMLHNPVRAGLVDDFRKYPSWYCRWEV